MNQQPFILLAHPDQCQVYAEIDLLSSTRGGALTDFLLAPMNPREGGHYDYWRDFLFNLAIRNQ